MCVYTCIAPQAYVCVDCTCVMYMYTVKVSSPNRVKVHSS